MKMFLAGGLGNQLFQFAAAHYLYKKNVFDLEVLNLTNNSRIKHAQLSILASIKSCSHGIIIRNWESKPSIVNRILDPWGTSLMKLLWGKRLDTRDNPNYGRELPFDLAGHKVLLGYFQDAQVVDSVSREMESHFFQLNHDNPEKFDFWNSKYEAIHIRGGDSLKQENRVLIGSLSTEYYRNAVSMSDSGMRRIVLTDDLTHAKYVLRGIRVDEMFSQEQMGPMETLQVMARSTRLIGANSTLSWWGGYFAAKFGAHVVLPWPYFRSGDFRDRDRLLFEGPMWIRSRFIE